MGSDETLRRDSRADQSKDSINAKKLEKHIHLVRRSLLAKPFPRRLLPYPDPNLYYVNGRPISQAALIYRPTKRILLLSKFPARLYTPKYVKPEVEKHLVSPEALLYKPTPRILELATHISPKKEGPKKPKKKNLKKLKKIKLFMQNRPNWLLLRAAPKVIPKPPPLEILKPAVPFTPEEREERFKILAQPKYKYKREVERPLVSKAALKYKISKNILQMSAPKELNPETILNMTFNPNKIKKSALNYKATERIKELATPNVRKKLEDTDVKENPFSVLPRALKAICTKRVKELAKPIERD